MSYGKVSCLLLLLTIAAFARTSARQEIEETYSRRYKAADIRYLYGMRYGRAEDFTSFDVNGEEVDLDSFYLHWMAQMGRTLKCRWQGEIIDFQWISEDEIRVKVKETFLADVRNTTYTKKSDYVLRHVSEDVWKRQSGQWVQVSTRVLERTDTLEPVASSSQ